MAEAENGHQNDIDQDNNLEEMLEVGPDCCIYKVPQYLRKKNEAAYTPCFISIGPLHYNKKELMKMERQKRRYLSEFSNRLNDAQQLVRFENYITSREQCIRGYYSVTSELQSSEYNNIILRDAVFIIELFMRHESGPQDFLLENGQYTCHIAQDLLLLENQIPYFVLNDLYSSSVFTNHELQNTSFFSLCVNFFRPTAGTGMFNWSFSKPSQLKHFTDLLRCAAVGQIQPMVQSSGGILDLPCATKLQKSGLQFKGIDRQCLHNISWKERKLGKWLPWFGGHELQIPRIIIFDEMEAYFRNLMALETFHYPTQSYICDYADLMDHLIDTGKDVDLLVEKGIIVNYVGDIDAIVRMFNGLNSQIVLRDSSYHDIAEKMIAHYRHPLNHLKATLKSVYFSNLWTGTATIAAAALLLLTLLQTIYSMKKECQGNSKDNETTS